MSSSIRANVLAQVGRLLALSKRLVKRRGALPEGPVQAVVMIAYYYPPHNEIGAARPYRFVRSLRRNGTDVAVICSSGMLRRTTDQQASAEADKEKPSPQRVPGADGTAMAHRLSAFLHFIQRMVLPYNDRLGWMPYAYAAGAQTLTSRSVLISTHPPVVTHLAALALKLRYGRPWIADFRDPLWGNPFRTSRRAAWIDPLVERLVVSLADAVIANTNPSAEMLCRRYPKLVQKIHTIWNGFDPEDDISPLPHATRERRTISHVGTLYGTRTPVAFAASLQRLIHQGTLPPTTVQFRQIGRIDPESFDPNHPALAELEALGCFYRTSRHMPQWEARREMLEADMLLLLDMNERNPGLQVPAKVFEYVRTGRPILALTVPNSATQHVLAVSGVPHACIDLGATTEVFDTLVLAFLSAQHESVAPSPRFQHQFSAEEQIKTLLSILETVGNSKNPGQGQSTMGLP
jgi:hypothetical protein